MILYGGSKPYPVSATPTAFASQIGQFPPYDKSPSPLNSQNKRFMPIRFFFCIYRRKRKSYQKENAEIRFRALRSATRATCP